MIYKPYFQFWKTIFKILFMKTLRLLFASLAFCLVFISQSNAQTITNLTPCWFEVKANVLPMGACTLTGGGPLYGVPGGAVITVPLPGPPASHWVPAYGVRRPSIPVKVVGTPLCGFGTKKFVGKCLGVDIFAKFAGGNLTIEP